MSGLVACCDDEEIFPRLFSIVEVIMNSMSRTVLACDEELSTICEQVQPPVVEGVKLKEGKKLDKVCVQKTAV